MKIRYGLGIAIFAIAIAAVFIAPNTYYLFILGMIAITTIVGVGLNILVGLSGQVSIGHAGFFAIGAYAASLLMTDLSINFWWALLGAIAVTAATGAALAAPAIRVAGPYLAMVTIAFGVIVERVLMEWVGLTGGFGGIMNIPKPTILGLEPAMRDVVLLAIAIATFSLLSFAALKHHPWGRAFQAVRDDEVAATAIGLNVLLVRIVAFTLSAGFTGVGGVLFASTVGFISPDSFTFHRSILFLLVVLLGGLGTVEGALVGAIVLVILPEFLHDFADYQLLVFGVLLLLTLWLTPDGIVSVVSRRFQRSRPVYPLEPSDTLMPVISHPDHRALVVQNVGIQFGGVRAVDQAYLTAEPGTITAVIGPNGAGKTTLLNLISGFYKTQTGTIHLGDWNLTQHSGLAIARQGITRTFQATRLFNSLSVLDNLRIAAAKGRLGNVLGALVGQGRSRQPEKFLLELLAFVGYRGDVHTTVGHLPFVDRRLVEIARALATQPQVLLLDEPGAGLSRQDKTILASLLRRIASTGIKVVLIEHDMDLVMPLSDKVVVMDGGQVISQGTPQQVQQDSLVLDAYLGVSDSTLSAATTDTNKVLLEVQHLSAGYGELQVLDQISLTVNQGELVAVIGANGAGKSTLLKSISQLIAPWAGNIYLEGANLNQAPSHTLAERGIVLVPEGRQVFGELSVYDNLRLGAFHRRDRAIESDLQAMLKRFPRLQERLHQRAGLLSGGEQQMLAIARGLMANPKVLLLDEPSLGLAPKLVTSLYATLAELRDEGITILLVDQMAALALSIANRVYLLESGRIVQSGLAQEMQSDPAIAHAYLGSRS
jgi:ABC-type branched-subunit amino acid transport system ATPase component/ABC-type branched-subunit amino acid transport system permease subunit